MARLRNLGCSPLLSIVASPYSSFFAPVVCSLCSLILPPWRNFADFRRGRFQKIYTGIYVNNLLGLQFNGVKEIKLYPIAKKEHLVDVLVFDLIYLKPTNYRDKQQRTKKPVYYFLPGNRYVVPAIYQGRNLIEDKQRN